MPYLTSSDPSAELDVSLMTGGIRFSVAAGPGLLASGWRGGQFVMYVPSPLSDFVVEKSDGTATGGFLLFQSEDYQPFPPPYANGPGSPQNYTSFQYLEGVGGQNVIALIADDCFAYFKVYETVSLVAGIRNGPPLVYSLNDDLKISENGLLCNDPDAELALVGIADPIGVGLVAAVPSARNNFRLGLGAGF